LKLYKQARSLDISIDIFATKGRMTVTDGIATVSLPHRPFEPAMAIDPAVVKQTYEDYIQHFPEFAAFLDLVLHARFATDRRHAFVWLHSSSSWGKGLLLAIFSKLGIVVDVSTKEIDKALEGSPVGLSMNDMLRAWILFVDEFKAASSELKLLNTQITLAPKNQLRCTVPLFTKLFASAESVRSLVGDGVESQFNNRFAYLSPSTHEQKIEDRPLFKDLGKSVYVGALANYVAGYLNAGVERLRAMGPVESSKVADVFLETYQAAHRLQATFGNLDDAVDDVVAEIRKCLIEYATWADTDYRSNILPDSVAGIGPALLATLKRSVLAGYISEGDGSKQRQKAIVLSDAEKFVKSYLALSGDRSTVGKMQYKSGEITAKLHMRLETFSASTRVRVYDAETGTTEKANKRGVVIFLPDPVATSSSNDGSWKKWSSDNL
jgi:hypothetical protein